MTGGTMDFFESQERAKRNTGRLVFLFIVGVAATAASVHLLLSALVGGGRMADPRTAALSLGSVLVVIGLGTLIKFAQMSHGGRAVAEALGGRRIDPASGDPSERRVLNVVEEMAIASGVRVPPVYVMEEAGINAFAAGNGERDAVIGVTRGCIESLSRDELQGVMAHEFSHIFHRDTRLNMRLVAWLGGIFAVSMVGRVILRAGASSRSSRGKNNGAGIALAIGLGLFLIGIVGYFFGRLIQSAVSRQREYLADASAVQYTRNPDGIAGALEKIARGAGSRLEAPAAAEFSHFLFANGIASLFSTHPPIEERIRRIRGARPGPAPAPRLAAETNGGALAGAAGAAASGIAPPVVPASAVAESRAAVGSIRPREIELARGILESAPAALVDAAHHPFDARAAVLSMLLSPDGGKRRAQLAAVAAADPALAEAIRRLAAGGPLQPVYRLPVLEVSAASLASLSPAQYAAFRTVLAQFIAADGEVDRLEWTVRILLRQAVEGRGAPPIAARRVSIDDIALVVSVLAWAGARDAPAAGRAWAAARAVERSLPADAIPAERCTLDALDGALRAFAGATAGMKRRLVDAAVACVAADGRTTVEEAELLRASCAAIGVPMPPMQAA